MTKYKETATPKGVAVIMFFRLYNYSRVEKCLMVRTI